MSGKPGSFEECAPIELEFPADKKLDDAVAGGSYYHIRKFGLVFFLLNEEIGFTLCVGHGNFHTGQAVRSFERVQSFSNRAEAEEVLQTVESLAFDFFKKFIAELDSIESKSTAKPDQAA